MQQACASADYKVIERLAHSIKSASANIGAVTLFAIAAELELQARKGHDSGYV